MVRIPKYQKLENSPSYLPKPNLTSQNGGNSALVVVNLHHIQYQHQCLSEWSKGELKLFWQFIKNIQNVDWETVYKSGGKSKTGFGYTVLPSYLYQIPENHNITSDLTFFELRVDERMRVHGYRKDQYFYLCWLDKDHAICK